MWPIEFEILIWGMYTIVSAKRPILNCKTTKKWMTKLEIEKWLLQAKLSDGSNNNIQQCQAKLMININIQNQKQMS